MVSYSKWVSVLFQEYPDAKATLVVSTAGEVWSKNKPLLQDATVSEAREYAKQV